MATDEKRPPLEHLAEQLRAIRSRIAEEIDCMPPNRIGRVQRDLDRLRDIANWLEGTIKTVPF